MINGCHGLQIQGFHAEEIDNHRQGIVAYQLVSKFESDTIDNQDFQEENTNNLVLKSESDTGRYVSLVYCRCNYCLKFERSNLIRYVSMHYNFFLENLD